MKKELESSIVSAVCDYLSLRGCLFYRNNNVPIFDPTKKVFRAMPKHTMRGLPDIVVIKDGIYIGLEVKRASGRLSEAQRAFGELLEAHGGRYHVVYSIDDVVLLGL